MNRPRPIYQYSTDELHSIVFKTIVEFGLGLGYYYDEATNQSIKIEKNINPNRYQPAQYLITYKHGFTEVTFSVDSIDEKEDTRMSCATINFTYNHNGKLYCRYFTTIRLHNPSKYKVGHWYYIQLKGDDIGPGQIKDIKQYTIQQLTTHVCALDMGLNLEAGKRMLLAMYKNKKINWQTQKLDFILIEMADKIIPPMPYEMFGVYQADEPEPMQTEQPKQADLFENNEKVA